MGVPYSRHPAGWRERTTILVFAALRCEPLEFPAQTALRKIGGSPVRYRLLSVLFHDWNAGESSNVALLVGGRAAVSNTLHYTTKTLPSESFRRLMADGRAIFDCKQRRALLWRGACVDLRGVIKLRRSSFKSCLKHQAHEGRLLPDFLRQARYAAAFWLTSGLCQFPHTELSCALAQVPD